MPIRTSYVFLMDKERVLTSSLFWFFTWHRNA